MANARLVSDPATFPSLSASSKNRSKSPILTSAPVYRFTDIPIIPVIRVSVSTGAKVYLERYGKKLI